jgi:hypothetical protein
MILQNFGDSVHAFHWPSDDGRRIVFWSQRSRAITTVRKLESARRHCVIPTVMSRSRSRSRDIYFRRIQKEYEQPIPLKPSFTQHPSAGPTEGTGINVPVGFSDWSCLQDVGRAGDVPAARAPRSRSRSPPMRSMRSMHSMRGGLFPVVEGPCKRYAIEP